VERVECCFALFIHSVVEVMVVHVGVRICCNDIITSRRRSKRLKRTSNVWMSTRRSWQVLRLWRITL